MADVDFKLLANAKPRSFKAGETIFRAGDPAGELYVVKNGSVRIDVDGRAVETVSDNGIFGEMALIEDRPRAGTVIAETDVDVVPIDQKQFLFMVRETPHFALNVMRVLANRLRVQSRE